MTEETPGINPLNIPAQFATIFQPNSATHKRKRFYIRYGGRSSAKSHSFATATVLRMCHGKEFVVCCREVHKTMADSVHRLLVGKIEALKLQPYFDVTDNEIRCTLTGSVCVFKGLGNHVKETIKSIEGATITWVEEADDVSEYSWTILLPTVVRTAHSEVWISFNTGLETDATYVRFVKNYDPQRMDLKKVNVHDLPPEMVPEGVREEMEADKKRDYDTYLNVWEGFPMVAKNGGVFLPENIKIIPAVPAGLRVVRGWDFASSAVVKGKDPDWTVGLKMGYNAATERYTIVHVHRFRGTPDEVEAQLILTTQNDGIEVLQDIPTDPGQAGKHQVAYFTKKLAGYRVETSLETGDKVVRAEPFASQVNVGNVDMVVGPWNDVLIQEFKGFNGDPNRKDDQVDAAARAFTRLAKPRYMQRTRIM